MLPLHCANPWPRVDDGLTSLHWLQDFSALGANSRAPQPGYNTPQRFQRAAMLPLHCANPWPRVDDGLTSLHWLQDFSALGANSRAPQPGYNTPQPGYNTPQPGYNTPQPGYNTPQPGYNTPQPGYNTPQPGYNTDAQGRPHYSCPTLICMAIQASEKRRLTLASIYDWFSENFSFYRCAKTTSWQSTIRHTLSVNKGFIKLPREKGESGKGGFWTVDPQHVERLLNGVYKVQLVPQSGSQQLPRNFEGVTWTEQIQPSQAVGGHKRKLPQASPTSLAKVPRHSSSSLLHGDEQTELGSVEGTFDLDALSEWASSRELTPDSGDALSGPSSTLPPIQHQLTELCSVANPAVSAPTSPPGCALDWLPQSQCTVPTEEDLVADYDWDAFLDTALSEELSQDSGEPLSPTPTEENQMLDFDWKSFLDSAFGGELSLD